MMPLIQCSCLGYFLFTVFCAYRFGTGKASLIVLAIVTIAAALFARSASDDGLTAFLVLLGYGGGFVLLATTVAFATGSQLRQGRFTLAAILLLLVGIYLWNARSSQPAMAQELALALQFAEHDPAVARLAGLPVKVTPLAQVVDRDAGLPGRYEFSVTGSAKPDARFSVFVDVSRQAGKVDFTVACATALSPGQRQVGVDACAQSPLPLPR